MMKRILLLTLIISLLLSGLAFAEKGYIAYVDDSKNILVVEVEPYKNYTCATYITNFSLEFPCTPAVNDVVFGNLNSYGPYKLYDNRLGGKFDVFTDEIMLSEEQATEWVRKQ